MARQSKESARLCQPVAAIRRVILVIVIAMMDGKLMQILARELALATAADPRIQFERLLTVGKFALIAVALRVGYNLNLAGHCWILVSLTWPHLASG